MNLSTEKLADTAERTFKTAVRYVSAVNQSRAAVVLDPMYETIAAAVLTRVPISNELRSETIDPDLFPKYAQNYKKTQWSVDDLDFSQARPELLTERQRQLIHIFAGGESTFTAAASFLHAFRNHTELNSFFALWLLEEFNHHHTFHRYLARMGEGWTEQRRHKVTDVAFRPYGEDAMEVAAANMYQELAAYLVYRSYARQLKDPWFARLMNTIAKDELRHYKFYEAVVAREIQRNPGFRKVALKHFFKATTPVHQISDSPSAFVDFLFATSFYFRKPEFDFMMRQTEYLFGDSLEGLFAWFFRKHLAPCTHCQTEVFRCNCETYE